MKKRRTLWITCLIDYELVTWILAINEHEEQHVNDVCSEVNQLLLWQKIFSRASKQIKIVHLYHDLDVRLALFKSYIPLVNVHLLFFSILFNVCDVDLQLRKQEIHRTKSANLNHSDIQS